MGEKRSRLFKYCWFKDHDGSINELANLAMKENWVSYTNEDKEREKKLVLINYIDHTFQRLSYEKKIIESTCGQYACFNTGLCTDNQEDIYAFLNKNKHQKATIPWYFIGFKKSSDRDLTKFSKLPDRAHYFDDPSELLYDTRIDLRYNADHIIDDNFNRFPEALKQQDKHMLINILEGAINDSKRRVERNYKTAIPQFYHNKIQLLLPLCLIQKGKADLALVVEKQDSGVYLASTILTLTMAYNNARLIAKPDDEWLRS
ncbi:DUF3825 domain-containing protein [Halobacteriovorax sp. GFR7]|uniref:DUF3825 domain-containing protein n=1 Tax=unclassified Halobacteriovorax TaxID=2639665 RepID=UPI003D96540C